MRTLTLCLIAVTACFSEPKPLTPESEFVDLMWEMKEPLKSSLECKEVGLALVEWEKKHGARFDELRPKIHKLVGANANNYDTVEGIFDEVATRCVHPKFSMPMPMMRHDDNVERVYKKLPKFTTGFELR